MTCDLQDFATIAGPAVYNMTCTVRAAQRRRKNIAGYAFTIYPVNDLICCWCGGLALFLLLPYNLPAPLANERINAMNEKTIEQSELVLSQEVSDEALEAAGNRTEIAGAWTNICTGVQCPG